MSAINNKENMDFSKFGKAFQERLTQLIFQDRQFADQLREVLDLNFFELKYLQLFTKKLFDYRDKYDMYPSVNIMTTILRTELEDDNDALNKQVRDYYARILAHMEIDDEQYIKDTSLDFCRRQKIKEALVKSAALMNKSSSLDEIGVIVSTALKLGTDNNFGYDYKLDFEKRFLAKDRSPVSSGWYNVDAITKGGLGRAELGVVIAPTGCHEKGTKILLYNGEFRNVESIVVGDLLMGPDSQPRQVLNLIQGNDKMYRINPNKGKSFTVNQEHILSLVRTNDGTQFANSIDNLSVKDYLAKNKTYKHLHKLYRSNEIEFAKSTPVKDPYMVGLMLGDGSMCGSNIRFTTADDVLFNEFKNYAADNNSDLAVYSKKDANGEFGKASDMMILKGKSNSIWEFFNEIGLTSVKAGDKFIPLQYKTSSVQERYAILAGLLDTDGSLSHNGYDYISKSKQLSEDVVFLCQSLGIAAYLSECQKCSQDKVYGTYYRVSISGNVEKIPCKVARKISAERKQKKNALRTSFDIQDIGYGDYYGFTVDKDNLYVMDDFFVTHNCGKSMVLVHLGAQALKAGLNVVHYTLELSDTVVATRYDACLTGIPLDALMSEKESVLDSVKNLKGNLIIKEYPTKSASTTTIKNHLKRVVAMGKKVDLIIVDYGDLLNPTVRYKEKRTELETIYEELRALAFEFVCPIWTASQTNRSGLNAEVVTMESISEAFNKCFVADFIFSVSRTIEDKKTNSGRIFIAKNRNGPDGIVMPIMMDTAVVKIEVLNSVAEHETFEEKATRKTSDKKKEILAKYRTAK